MLRFNTRSMEYKESSNFASGSKIPYFAQNFQHFIPYFFSPYSLGNFSSGSFKMAELYTQFFLRNLVLGATLSWAVTSWKYIVFKEFTWTELFTWSVRVLYLEIFLIQFSFRVHDSLLSQKASGPFLVNQFLIIHTACIL